MPSDESVLISDSLSSASAPRAYGLGGAGAANPIPAQNWRRSRTGFQRLSRLTSQRNGLREEDIRLEERRKESARIAHELHDTLLQGFLGASILLHHAVDEMAVDSPCRPALNRALSLVCRAIDEGRAAILGIHTVSPAPSSLEGAFVRLVEEVKPAANLRFQVFVQGKPRTLQPEIHEQLFLIGREAVINALRHSGASRIEVEVRYLRRRLQVCVRDDGCGINEDVVRKPTDSQWGLSGMRWRAEKICAQFDIWSGPGVGTEVRVAVLGGLATAAASE